MARKKAQVRKTKSTRRRPPEAKLSMATKSAAVLALGLGLAAPAPAEAIIVHFDLNVTLTAGEDQIVSHDLDPNNLGFAQFSFYHAFFKDYPYAGLTSKVGVIYANDHPYTKVVGSSREVSVTIGPYTYTYNAPFVTRLPQGASIGPTQTFLDYNYGGLAGRIHGTLYDYPVDVSKGDFLGQRGYVGLQFLDNGGDTIYGWVDVSMLADASSMTIYGYAYETEADTPINAGAVPVPSSLLLMASGALGVLAYRRRRQNKEQRPD